MLIDLSDLPLGAMPERDVLPERQDAPDPLRAARFAEAHRRLAEAALQPDGGELDALIGTIEGDLRDDPALVQRLRGEVRPLMDDRRLRGEDLRAAALRETARSGLDRTLAQFGKLPAASEAPERRALYAGTVQRILAHHVAAGLIDADEAARVTEAYDRQLDAEQADRLARREPAMAIDLLRDPANLPGLDAAAREGFLAAAEARLAAQAGAAPPDIRGIERAAIRLERQLETGEADLGDVELALRRGAIDQAAGRRLKAQAAARMRRADALRRVQAALDRGEPVDMSDAGQREGLDAHYLAAREAWSDEGLSPEEIRARIADYVARAGAIPDALLIRMQAIAAEGTAEEQAELADLRRRLDAKAPQLLSQSLAQDNAAGVQVASLGDSAWSVTEGRPWLKSFEDPGSDEEPAPEGRLSGSARERVRRSIEEAGAELERRREELSESEFQAATESLKGFEKLLSGLSEEELSSFEKSLGKEKLEVALLPLAYGAAQVFLYYGMPLLFAAWYAYSQHQKRRSRASDGIRFEDGASLGAGRVERRAASPAGSGATEGAGGIEQSPHIRPLARLPDISSPVSRFEASDLPNLVEYNVSSLGFSFPVIVKNGNEKDSTKELADEIIKAGEEINKEKEVKFEHTHGGGKKIKRKELYMKNSITGGRDGSSRSDLAFKSDKTGNHCHVNTYTPRAEGGPDTREWVSAIKILRNKKASDVLLLVRKLALGESYDKRALKDALRLCFKLADEDSDEKFHFQLYNPPRSPLKGGKG